MHKHIILRIAFLTLLVLMTCLSAQAQDLVTVDGAFQQWHSVSVRVTCPEADCGAVSETSVPNPFTDYRLLVTFTSPDGAEVLEVPGFYAGDGQAAYTEATSGNVWMAHLTPHETGEWTYRVSFQTGPDRVLDRLAGNPIGADGATGSFIVGETDKTGDDFRAKGFLRYANSHYFYFSGSNTPFLKNGAGSPENLLHYHEFHNTYQQDSQPVIPPHEFAPHLPDYREGDPLWGPDRSRGKGVIGALNYLRALEVNSYYFIVNNTALDGNGQDTGVWPWLTPAVESRDRFSVAKLAQWEVVFSHMDSLGISMNLVTQDRINQWDLDGGELGRIRKLLYRELVARFGHHLAVVWNLGEENSATTAQIRDYSNFISDWDVYTHPIVSQANGTLDAHDRYYVPLLGFENFAGASMQVGLTDLDSLDIPQSRPGRIHDAVLKWVKASKEAGRPWVVVLDEIGHWSDGIVPDRDPRDPSNRRARREGFWGTLMAGGAGADWYFGSDPFEYNDIWMEDFRFRAEFFERTRNGVDMILDSGLPFWEMENMNAITSAANTWVLGKTGEAYFVYSPYLEPFELNLPAGTYVIRWYDAFAGGPLQEGSVTEVAVAAGIGSVPIGSPYDFAEDAVAVVTKKPVVAGEENEAPRPDRRAALHPSYPNPAGASTTITFELFEPAPVVLTVYDLLGRTVEVLTQAFHPRGEHRYAVDTSNLPSGLYFYRLDVGDAGHQVRTMAVVHP
ncbi:MAG: DUF5060 domain-containing protein [Rhodothermales bacterium]|nr:DUF5060 domain-containing protein [Rhodothermales bacterium]